MQEGEVYILEVNPRASRTVPFVSKATGVPLAGHAPRVMAGESLKKIGFTEEIVLRHVAVKEAVLPFARFPGCDVRLTPESALRLAREIDLRLRRIASGDRAASVVVAVNTERNAPIFACADYGIVADWEETIDEWIQYVKERKQQA